MKSIFLVASLLLSLYSSLSVAEDEYNWQIHTSAYTHHFNYDPKHNDHQQLINLERYNQDDWLVGAASFQNSFNQASQYVYIGKSFHPLDDLPNLHFKLTGGLIHGYKGPYKKKIAFNSQGVAPAALPSVGYSYQKVTTEVILLGTAGYMWTVGYKF